MLPTLFVSHGAPPLAIDREKGAALSRWGAALWAAERPRALLVLSAHWEASVATIGTLTARPLLYDFYGFPEELSRVRYEPPVAADVADRVASLIPSVARQDDRPFDHGVWVPLVHMAPAADLPLLQLALPRSAAAADLLNLGRALAPLCDDGVTILGSGGFVHNLARLDWRDRSPPPAWAEEFDAWAVDALDRSDLDALAAYREKAPAVRIAHPTGEHFAPLLVAAGAARMQRKPTYPISGFEYGSLSRRAVELS